MPNVDPRRILIIGASGELGAAIARYYARGHHDALPVKLMLWGRSQQRLDAAAQQCASFGAQATVRSIDLTDIEGVVSALEADDRADGYDLLVIASGRGDVRPQQARVEPTDIVQQLAIVNYAAPAVIASKMAENMAKRGGGAIIIVGSAASFHALPFAASYAGSKAGLARFAQALGIAMKPFGVHIGLISPGFIDTAGGRKAGGARPFLKTPDQVAERIGKIVQTGRSHDIFPWPFVLLRWFDRSLPPALRDRLLRLLAP